MSHLNRTKRINRMMRLYESDFAAAHASASTPRQQSVDESRAGLVERFVGAPQRFALRVTALAGLVTLCMAFAP